MPTTCLYLVSRCNDAVSMILVPTATEPFLHLFPHIAIKPESLDQGGTTKSRSWAQFAEGNQFRLPGFPPISHVHEQA